MSTSDLLMQERVALVAKSSERSTFSWSLQGFSVQSMEKTHQVDHDKQHELPVKYLINLLKNLSLDSSHLT